MSEPRPLLQRLAEGLAIAIVVATTWYLSARGLLDINDDHAGRATVLAIVFYGGWLLTIGLVVGALRRRRHDEFERGREASRS